MVNILTPEHRRWEEFCVRLGGAEGCDFQRGGIWRCGNDKSYTTSILESMPEIDTEKSLDYLHDYGGPCDCEILFNITL